MKIDLDEVKRSLYELGKEMFEKQGYVEIGMDHFALPTDSLSRAAVAGNLHRNFMGYSTTQTRLKGWYFGALGFNEQTAFWIKVIAYVLFIFPEYQLLILAYGTLLGQFDFFWEKEKRMLKLVLKPFRNE